VIVTQGYYLNYRKEKEKEKGKRGNRRSDSYNVTS